MEIDIKDKNGVPVKIGDTVKFEHGIAEVVYSKELQNVYFDFNGNLVHAYFYSLFHDFEVIKC